MPPQLPFLCHINAEKVPFASIIFKPIVLNLNSLPYPTPAYTFLPCNGLPVDIPDRQWVMHQRILLRSHAYLQIQKEGLSLLILYHIGGKRRVSWGCLTIKDQEKVILSKFYRKAVNRISQCSINALPGAA
jgi:hypothetical protein